MSTSDTIPDVQPVTRPCPSPTSPAWSDPATVDAIAAGNHLVVHPKAQYGCNLCPPVSCVCGSPSCGSGDEHRRLFAGAESSWRAVA